MRAYWEKVWSFETARFRVVAEATECLDDPADSFEFADDIEAVRSGRVAWFDARVRVLLIAEDGTDGEELGADYLGCCAYDRAEDLFRDHAKGVEKLKRLRRDLADLDSRYRGGERGKEFMKRRRETNREFKAWNRQVRNARKLKPEFVTCSYGTSMVNEAVRQARVTLAKMGELATTLRPVSVGV